MQLQIQRPHKWDAAAATYKDEDVPIDSSRPFPHKKARRRHKTKEHPQTWCKEAPPDLKKVKIIVTDVTPPAQRRAAAGTSPPRAGCHQAFRRSRLGATFRLNDSDSKGGERILPFDPLPRLISSREWSTLNRGLKQRLEALREDVPQETQRGREGHGHDHDGREEAREAGGDDH